MITIEEFKKQLSENKSAFVLFDIDGVVCKCFDWRIERKLSMDDWMHIKSNTEIDPTFFEILDILQSNQIKYAFLTGRKQKSLQITEGMFLKYELFKNIRPRIYFFNDDGTWTIENYAMHKYEIIKRYAKEYDIVYMVDDTRSFLEYLEKFCDLTNIRLVYHSLAMLKEETFPEIIFPSL